MKKQTAVRIDPDAQEMLRTINSRPTTAAQTAIEVFIWLRRATIAELKNQFSKEELIALADTFKGILPDWKLAVNPSVLITYVQEAEKYQYSISRTGSDPELLISKLNKLTSAQSTILLLEIVTYWDLPPVIGRNNFDTLLATLSPTEQPPLTPIHFRDKQ